MQQNKWIERWYGSPDLKGWSIIEEGSRKLIAYLGELVDSESVTYIVMAHNKSIERTEIEQ